MVEILSTSTVTSKFLIESLILSKVDSNNCLVEESGNLNIRCSFFKSLRVIILLFLNLCSGLAIQER